MCRYRLCADKRKSVYKYTYTKHIISASTQAVGNQVGNFGNSNPKGGVVRFLASLNDEVHVEVDDFVVEPVEIEES